MPDSPNVAADIKRIVAIGFAIVFVIVTGCALLLGADLIIALVVGLAVGVFVGGGIGLLWAGKAAGD
jgi:hypothetical protein